MLIRAHTPRMRGVKAEGGWAVVCTEEVEIHHSTETAPFVEGRLWDDQDIPAHERLTEAVHEHGSLAGIELVHQGHLTSNLYSREPPMGVAGLPTYGTDPVQARRMNLQDIEDLRRWHRNAVRRSLQAGYDLVYVYAGHNLTVIQHFLSPLYNDRTDAYGGSLENRARLLREILEDTLEEVDGRAAVACRICVDELYGDAGLGRSEIEQVLGLVGELPDVWDFMVGEWDFDSITSRFAGEGAQEEYVRGPQGPDQQARGGRRPLHVAGHDGADDPRRRARPHRRGATIDRRPVPAEEDRGGPLGGHPRVHRVQHLRLGRLHPHAAPLHAEPEHGGGVAPRLASGADPRRRHRTRRCSSSGQGRRGSRRR